MKNIALIISLIVLSGCASNISDGSYAWGILPQGIFTNPIADIDSSSAARVIFDKAYYKFNRSDFSITISRHKRIQILKESGKEYANIKVPYWHDEKIYDLKAQAINSNGTIVRLEKKNIFEEGDSKGWMYKVFAIPGVTEDCIIEYQYRLISSRITRLEPWYFQNEIPTVESTISIEFPSELIYNTYLANSPEADFKPLREEILNPNGKRTAKYTWSFSNLPPIKEEPYMTAPIDYMCRLNFQLLEIRFPGMKKTFVESWDDIYDLVMKYYDPFVDRSSGEIRRTVDRITGSARTRTDKIKLLYEFVRDSIETTKITVLYGDRLNSPKKILSNRQGTRIEKNLLLINLLNTARITSYPLLISTRTNGIPDLRHPRLDSFNHLLAYIPSRKQSIAMDTRFKYYPFGMLPSSANVSNGLLLGKKYASIINIPENSFKNNRILVQTDSMRVDNSGTLHAHAQFVFEGYMQSRYHRLHDDSESKIDFIKDYLLDEINDVSIDSIQTNIDSVFEDNNLIVNVLYEAPYYAQVVGEEIHIPITHVLKESENRFTLENRTFPIDYNYTRFHKENYILKLPPDYIVSHMPENVDNKIFGHEYRRFAYEKYGRLYYEREMRISQTHFLPTDYKAITGFYGNIIRSVKSKKFCKSALGSHSFLGFKFT